MKKENNVTDKFDLGEIKFEGESGKYAGDIPIFKSTETKVVAFNYPLCCTGAVLASFGGSGDGYWNTKSTPCSIQDEISAWVNAIREGEVFPQRKEFICASTTTEQEEANEALETLGFERSKLMTNNTNEYALYTWVLALSGYEEDE